MSDKLNNINNSNQKPSESDLMLHTFHLISHMLIFGQREYEEYLDARFKADKSPDPETSLSLVIQKARYECMQDLYKSLVDAGFDLEAYGAFLNLNTSDASDIAEAKASKEK